MAPVVVDFAQRAPAGEDLTPAEDHFEKKGLSGLGFHMHGPCGRSYRRKEGRKSFWNVGFMRDGWLCHI